MKKKTNNKETTRRTNLKTQETEETHKY